MSGKYNESNQSISCSVCKQCGGCQYVDIPYEKELKKKSAYLKQLFEGICTVGEVHGMYRPAFYRNKVHAVVGLDKQKGIVTGTYAEGTHRLVPVDVCMIEDQKADSIIATLRELFASFKYVPYNEDTHRGFMRHILIRRGFSTKEMMVVLVTADNKFPSKNNFLKALLEKHPDITTVVQNINDYSTSMVLGKANKVLYGKGYIQDEVDHFLIFYQKFNHCRRICRLMLYDKLQPFILRFTAVEPVLQCLQHFRIIIVHIHTLINRKL